MDQAAAAPLDLKGLVRTIPDYPKAGILFRDITTLMADPLGFRAAVGALVLRFCQARIECVAAVEARGFILGGAVAHGLGCGFVPLRKGGRLPAETIGVDYLLEYGSDRLEVHAGAIRPGERVLLVDDVIATGGTAAAAAGLITQAGGTLVGAGFVIDLPELGGAMRLGRAVPVHALMSF